MNTCLTQLAMRSKANWGYDEHLMELWRDQLTILPDYIKNNIVEVAYHEEQEAGFFSIHVKEKELEDFWIDPVFKGKGIGKRMFQEVQEKMRELGITAITIVSDPNACGFYEKMGATIVGEYESVPKGRKLPIMKYSL